MRECCTLVSWLYWSRNECIQSQFVSYEYEWVINVENILRVKEYSNHFIYEKALNIVTLYTERSLDWQGLNGYRDHSVVCRSVTRSPASPSPCTWGSSGRTKGSSTSTRRWKISRESASHFSLICGSQTLRFTTCERWRGISKYCDFFLWMVQVREPKVMGQFLAGLQINRGITREVLLSQVNCYTGKKALARRHLILKCFYQKKKVTTWPAWKMSF